MLLVVSSLSKFLSVFLSVQVAAEGLGRVKEELLLNSRLKVETHSTNRLEGTQRTSYEGEEHLTWSQS